MLAQEPSAEAAIGPVDATVPILVLRRSHTVFHHGALGIIRSAGRMGIPVHGFHEDRFAPAAMSRYSSGKLVEGPEASAEQTLATLRRFRREVGTAVLVPIDDAGSVFVEEQTDALQDDFLFPAQPVGLARALSSKREMYRLCQEHDIPTPPSEFPRSEDELFDAAGGIGFPVVAKCIDASAPGGQSAPRVVIARDREQLVQAYRAMESPTVPNVMLQEYIPGTPESVWMFNGYFDARSECRIGFTGRKIRQSPPYTGATTLGICLPNRAVEQTTRRFMKAVGYRGILDIGYRFDARDGRYKLLDVNPRIGATFRLFVAGNGMDVLRAMYLDLTGQPVPASAAQPGRRWVVEPLDLQSSLTYRRRRELTLRGWACSLQDVQEAAWFARDDPLPFAGMWARLLVDAIPRRAISRRRRGRRHASP